MKMKVTHALRFVMCSQLVQYTAHDTKKKKQT